MVNQGHDIWSSTPWNYIIIFALKERKKERKKEELFEPRKDIPVCLASSPHVAKLKLTPTMEVDP